MEAIERRALFLLLTVAIVLVFDRAEFTTQTGRGWQVVIYVLGLLALAAAATMLVVVIAPQTVVDQPRERRERLLFLALAFLVAAMLTSVLLRIYATYYVHRHGGSIF